MLKLDTKNKGYQKQQSITNVDTNYTKKKRYTELTVISYFSDKILNSKIYQQVKYK